MLFLRMLNFSNFAFLEEQIFVKENEGSSGVFENILFFEMEISNLFNYLADDLKLSLSMAWNLDFNYGTGESTLIIMSNR
jgi:hypothetical protein